ncbi:ATP-binding cassette domain-containing protein, partial [Cutibacterium acnes]
LSAELRDRFPWWEIVVALFFIAVVLRLPGGLMTLVAPLKRWLPLRAVNVPLQAAPTKPRKAAPLSVGFDDVHVRMGDVTILDGLTLTTGAQAILCVIGPNGAGKSTLTKVMAGVVTLTSGSMTVDGSDVAPRTPLEARNLGIAMVFQENSLVPTMTVAQNLFLGQEKFYNRL